MNAASHAARDADFLRVPSCARRALRARASRGARRRTIATPCASTAIAPKRKTATNR